MTCIPASSIDGQKEPCGEGPKAASTDPVPSGCNIYLRAVTLGQPCQLIHKYLVGLVVFSGSHPAP